MEVPRYKFLAGVALAKDQNPDESFERPWR
jgi:hypothetical protein